MDFLSAVTLGLATGDCLVLNSVANVGKAVKHLDGYGRIDCFLDRDEAGRRTLEDVYKRQGLLDVHVVIARCERERHGGEQAECQRLEDGYLSLIHILRHQEGGRHEHLHRVRTFVEK